MKASEIINEKWSQKYKNSINCSHPKGFSQRAHCAGKKKHNEDITMEMVCPDCGMCQTHGNLNEIKKGQKDANGYTRCWPGKHAVGTKKGKNGGQVRNCVPNKGVAEATGDERFDTMMGRMQKEPQIPDSQMPPTDVRDLYQWAVKNNKPYHKTFATWANREGFKSVAPALQKAGNLDSDALDYWTPDVWEMWYGSKMPKHWSKERIPDELRDYLETVFDAYDHIWTDWPTEYRQIGQQGVAEGSEQTQYSITNSNGKELRTINANSPKEAFDLAVKLIGSNETLRKSFGLVKLTPKPHYICLLYTSPSPRDRTRSRMPSSA